MKPLLMFLLWAALLCFGLDLGHMIYHLSQDPVLWQIEGVPAKFLIKALIFLIPFLLIFFRNRWKVLLGVLLLVLCLPSCPGFAATSCQHARELLDQSGTARDADEDFLGRIKRQPPYGTFPSDMDKISWWGVFKPFEFWESPEFHAVWINPQGEEVAHQNFFGNKCSLGKTTLRAENRPRGEFESGMWKVIVTCDDYLIDRQSFAVLPPRTQTPANPADGKTQPQPTAMIWAKDMLNEKE